MDGPAVGMLSGGALVALALFCKATLLLGIAWLAATVARRSSAAVRHGIWVAALLGVVALPLSSRWLPALEVVLPQGLVAPAPLPASTATLVTTAPGAPMATAAPNPEPLPGATIDPARRRNEAGDGFSWLTFLAGLWAVGVLARAGWLAAQVVRVRGQTRRSASLAGDHRGRAAAGVAHLLRVRRPVRVLESGRITTPLTCGILRPVILLPRDSRDWPADRLRVVLLHELAHIHRWDYVTCLVAEAACALYWPIPLVWVARRGVHTEQEQASDDLVLAAGTSAVDYADHLLAIARALRSGGRSLPGAIGMARETGLKHRIRTILDGRTRRVPLRSRHGAATLLGLAGIGLPLAALRPVAAEPAPSAPPVGTGVAGTAPALPTPPTAAAAVGALFLWLEAEHALLHGAMELREDLDASSGHFVTAETGAGALELSLHLPRADRYRIWVRAKSGMQEVAALRVSLDGQAEYPAKGVSGETHAEDWYWMAVGAPGSEGIALGAGVHTLRLDGVAPGARLDRVLVTTDSVFLPEGPGASTEEFVPVYTWLDSGVGTLAEVTEFEFSVDAPGSYVLWGRVLGRGDEANSFFLSLDGAEEVVWDAPQRELGQERGRWTWDPASAREVGGRSVDPLILELAPGRHTVRLRPREAGTGLGGLLVTNDLAYRPRGAPQGTPSVRVWLEAESARPAEALLVRRGGGSTGSGYLEAAARDRGVSDPGDGGAASLTFELPHPGVYTLWARTVARTTDEDSFWIRVNDGPWLRWNGIPQSRDWRWSAVHDGDGGGVEPLQLALPAGANRIEIARREGGARVDRLLVTNEDSFESTARVAE